MLGLSGLYFGLQQYDIWQQYPVPKNLLSEDSQGREPCLKFS